MSLDFFNTPSQVPPVGINFQNTIDSIGWYDRNNTGWIQVAVTCWIFKSQDTGLTLKTINCAECLEPRRLNDINTDFIRFD